MGILKTLTNVVYKFCASFFTCLGIDSTIKTTNNLFKESLTFKGGCFDKKYEGDALQRKIAQQNKQANDRQLELLEEIKNSL